jgi:hypothetical protein
MHAHGIFEQLAVAFADHQHLKLIRISCQLTRVFSVMGKDSALHAWTDLCQLKPQAIEHVRELALAIPTLLTVRVDGLRPWVGKDSVSGVMMSQGGQSPMCLWLPVRALPLCAPTRCADSCCVRSIATPKACA